MYRGKIYTVSCDALGCPPTKEASASAANRWWTAKRAEIDAARPHAAHLGELERRRSWALSRDAAVEARNLAAEIARVGRGGEPADEASVLSDAFRAQFGQEPPTDPERLRNLYATGAVWRDRLLRERPAPPGRTVGGLVDRYLEGERARVDAGQFSVSGYANARRSLFWLRDWIGAGAPIDAIDADRWEAWWLHLLAAGGSVETRRKALNHGRAFVEWAAGLGLLPPPANLRTRRHRFGGGARAIVTMTIEEVRRLIDASPGQLRLHLLLMANCGMTQRDIADLHPCEVDWERGRITRKRSKTRDQSESVPTVEYPLWPITRDLLRQYGRRQGDRVLTTETGRPWVRDAIMGDGRRHRVDAIRSNYAHVARRLGFTKPMKLLRKTSSSLLETHDVYGRYAQMFLGQSPRTVADRHYVRPDQAKMDRAVGWLGEQYGFVAP
jgi:integrase